jgi:DNA-binding transcriptional MerR regulator
VSKSPEAFRTISEVAQELALPQHVLRFWETRFTSIKPMKRGGGRRYYRPDDVDLLRGIRALLYGEGYTIRGVQRILKEQGPRSIIAAARGNGAPPPAIVPPRPAPTDGVRAMPATRPAPAVRRLPEIDEGLDEGDADLRVQPAFAPKEFRPQAVAQPVAAPGEKAAAPSAAVRRLEATLAHLLELKRRLDAARD